MSNMMQDGVATTSAKPEHLVLYFDVNKTIIMHDPVQGKGLEHILNDLLTERAYGRVTTDASGDAHWTWNGQPALHQPASTIPLSTDPRDVSYGAFLRSKYPMSLDPVVAQHHKKQRKLLRQHFTSPRYAGEALAADHRALLASLTLPPAMDPSARAAAGLCDTSHVFLVPAFLEVVAFLHHQDVSFNLVFRTFGDDLTRIAVEFNCFCSGGHPLLPLTAADRMDGTGTRRIDRRVRLENKDATSKHPARCGTFWRSDTTTALVMGTLQQPRTLNDRALGLEFYQTLSDASSLQIYKGIAAIYDVLTTQWRSQQATLAIRDDYAFWFARGEVAAAGKLLPFDVQATNTLSLFLDDNILEHDAHIVDVRDVCGDVPIKFEGVVQDVHLVRVEPLEVIAQHSYFIDKIQNAIDRWQQIKAAR